MHAWWCGPGAAAAGARHAAAACLDGVQHVDGAHDVVGLCVNRVLAVNHGVGGRALLAKVHHRVGLEGLAGKGRGRDAGMHVGWRRQDGAGEPALLTKRAPPRRAYRTVREGER